MQVLTPVEDPNASHAKRCAAPNTSHANPYACTASQQFKQLPMLGSLPTAPTLPYASAGSQCFICKSLCLCRFPTIQKIPYAGAGFQKFTHKSLSLYRFPTLHTHILMLVQVLNNLDNSLRLGSLPTILKIYYTTKINNM
ncbi:hypothetical protein O181_094505 [Austropuccinia psidii MF-1]|uniref:Uncharacterized protein n=1 Tax=Austropuccinia psidii MF-1 TaxID=1389203 RepID=A0A9Q3J263_9BASI|nr:hypothetical protein [Austropuccinia psidii MF-1]